MFISSCAVDVEPAQLAEDMQLDTPVLECTPDRSGSDAGPGNRSTTQQTSRLNVCSASCSVPQFNEMAVPD